MAKPTSVGPRRPPLARSLPLGYLGVAVLLAVALLPTALRPPQDQQSTSAAFSPDAPPEDTPPEALLQSLRQARSSTAGAAETISETQLVEVVEEGEEAAPPPPPPPPRRRAGRNGCFGDPPRQTESLYSALCVPAFTGESNGGRTSPGVDENEIRVAVTVPLDSEVPEGKLGRDFSDADIKDTRDLKILQAYINDRFEFYRRYLQLVVIKQSTTNENHQRGSVETARSYDVFAMIGNAAAAVNEAIRLKIVDFGSSNNPVPFYNDAFPYAYSFTMDSWQTRYMGTELICKHFAGKPPGELNERMADPFIDYNSPRVWGLVSYQDTTRTGATAQIRDLLRRCGVELKLAQEYNITSGQSGLAGVMSKFRAEGVSTVILNVDGLTPTVLTEEADRLQYFPEYVHTGSGEMDSNGSGQLMNDRQARHVVGLSPNEIARPDEEKDWYRAYKEMDPDGEPDEGDFPGPFRSLQQLAGGIQHAGPNLTPETLWEGLRKQPYRTPDPIWAIGGGYRDSLEFAAYKDLTYEDYMSLIWFDQTADDAANFTGAWCHVFLGKRFKVGELPTDPIPWRDPSQCIVTPPRGQQG
jgi:hypothetical protein